MPLDPMLANPAMVKLADPMESYSNALKNVYLMNQIDEARAGREEKNALRESYAKAVKPDGGVDLDLARTNIARTRGELLPTFDKTQAEIAKMKGDSEKTLSDAGLARAKELASTLDSHAKSFVGVSTDPNIGQNQYYRVIVAMANDPVLSRFRESQGVSKDQFISEELDKAHAAAQNPQTWQQLIVGRAAGAQKMVDTFKNKITMMDNGGTTKMLSTNEYDPNAQPKVLGTYQNTESPKAPRTTINVDNKGPSAFNTEAGKESLKEYAASRNAAIGAGKAYDAAASTLALVNDAMTGAGTEYGERALAIMKQVGLTNKDDDYKLKATQLLQKHLAKNVFDLVAQMKRDNVPINRLTNQELTMIEKGAPNITMDAATIKDLLMRAQEDLRQSVLEHNHRLNVLSSNPETATGMRMFAAHPIDIPGIPAESVAVLRANPDAKHMSFFEKTYKLPPGSAADLLGGTSTQGAPFR